MGEKKNRLIKKYLDAPFAVGDRVMVAQKYFKDFTNSPEKKDIAIIKTIDGENLGIAAYVYDKEKIVTVKAFNVEKDISQVGANPFTENAWKRELQTINYSIESIVHLLYIDLVKDRKERFDAWKINGISVKETNFNPYVIDKDGNKQYYQRDYVWTLDEKRLLIDSIYKRLNCGQILVRVRSFSTLEKAMKAGDTEICFRDVVDGKQRLNTLHEFITDKFTDSNGNYFSDLSERAQWEFYDSMSFTYAEMGESATDEDVIAAFLNVNFTGVPQSKEHIEYVEKIANMMK